MILAFDTSSAACTVALFDGSGQCIAHRDERIDRGHAERLVPLIAELLGDLRPSEILVGVGPGSFTGIRVGIAAAQGLAIGWDVPVHGLSSLALLVAGVVGPVAAAVKGGHGELFVQQFDDSADASAMLNCRPEEAATFITAPLVIGSGAETLVAHRGFGEARDQLPSASNSLLLPLPLRTLAPRPHYARAPDAKPRDQAA
jgi:tRNA threonylcarbamoyl adenosine modification protein YeaZ